MNLAEIAPRRYFNPETGRPEGEHCTIIGQTGFGKSYLVARFARERRFVVVHNGKRSEVWSHAPGYKNCESVGEFFLRADERDHNGRVLYPKLVYTPARGELRDRGAQEAYWEYLYQRGDTTAIDDEMTLTCEGQWMPDARADILTGGRERGLELWGCTQQPVYVPNLQFTQSRSLYCFYLALEGHRKKVASIMPGVSTEAIEALPARRFYWFREGMRTAYSKPLQVVEARQEEPVA